MSPVVTILRILPSWETSISFLRVRLMSAPKPTKIPAIWAIPINISTS
ncbi:MAG: hypothetical protein ACFFFB_25820 [Candidatus Heimdallarchaeota archaeon]